MSINKSKWTREVVWLGLYVDERDVVTSKVGGTSLAKLLSTQIVKEIPPSSLWLMMTENRMGVCTRRVIKIHTVKEEVNTEERSQMLMAVVGRGQAGKKIQVFINKTMRWSSAERGQGRKCDLSPSHL